MVPIIPRKRSPGQASLRVLTEPLVDRVVVTGEDVEIRYVIPTSPKSEQIRFCHLRLDYFNRPPTGNMGKQLFHISIQITGSPEACSTQGIIQILTNDDQLAAIQALDRTGHGMHPHLMLVIARPDTWHI